MADKTEMELLNLLIPQQKPRVPVRQMLRRAGKAKGSAPAMTDALAREILGVTASSDFVAIKAAWRKASQQYHPDKHQALPERLRKAAEAEMKRINEAFRFLEGKTAADF